MKKTLTSLLVLAGLIQLTGCSTPAYSARERANLIGRNIALEWQMMQDDADQVACDPVSRSGDRAVVEFSPVLRRPRRAGFFIAARIGREFAWHCPRECRSDPGRLVSMTPVERGASVKAIRCDFLICPPGACR
jgi:hypothetical protein